MHDVWDCCWKYDHNLNCIFIFIRSFSQWWLWCLNKINLELYDTFVSLFNILLCFFYSVLLYFCVCYCVIHHTCAYNVLWLSWLSESYFPWKQIQYIYININASLNKMSMKLHVVWNLFYSHFKCYWYLNFSLFKPVILCLLCTGISTCCECQVSAADFRQEVDVQHEGTYR